MSIVLPVYNEAGHLLDEIKRIQHAMDESDQTYEVLVVDDGSTDGSGDIANLFRRPATPSGNGN